MTSSNKSFVCRNVGECGRPVKPPKNNLVMKEKILAKWKTKSNIAGTVAIKYVLRIICISLIEGMVTRHTQTTKEM